METPLITIHDAQVSHFGTKSTKPLFENLHFALHKGQHTALLGANGAGKSSFLSLLRGEMYPHKGHVLWHCDGKVESSPIVGRAMTSLVSSAQQAFYTRQAWHLSALDILLTAFADSQLLYTTPDNMQVEHAHTMATRLGCRHFLHMNIPALSQGQLRLILLGRALLRRCPVLLLDEYMDGLDADTRLRILDILKEETAQCTMVVTAHRASSIPPWITRSVYIHDGVLYGFQFQIASCNLKLVGCGENAVSPCLRNASHFERDILSRDSNSQLNYGKFNWELELHDKAPAQSTPQHICVQSHCAPSKTPTRSVTHPLIVVENATVFMEREPVLHNICWTMHTGEHWRIGGGNGAGKSTFLRLLAGELYAAYGGYVERFLPRHSTHNSLLKKSKIAGCSKIVRCEEAKKVKMRGVLDIHKQFDCFALTTQISVFQQPDKPVTELSVIRRAIRLVSDKEQACYAQTRERVHDITGLALVLSGYDGSVGVYRTFSEVEIACAQALLKRFGLLTLENRRIRTLSSGQLRRLFLARALLASQPATHDLSVVSVLPEILLLDEPFSGLDASSRGHMMDVLENIAADVHIVLVSHYDDDCPSCINRNAHLEKGHLHV